MRTAKFSYLPEERQTELKNIAKSICRPGCGILAADETPLAMEDRFKHLNIPNNAETRRKYRQMLFSCSKSDLTPLSAVILHNETLYQKNDQEVPLLDIIAELGIVPGVTLDKGWVELAGTDGREVFTQGLDDLDARCKEYKRLGCQFAKWRMVVSIAEDLPSIAAVEEGARGLAMYATVCQRNGLVPIIEPDIGRGGDHTALTCLKVTEMVLATVYKALADHHVFLEGTLLKPNMVTSGTKCESQADPQEVASLTLLSLSRHVPPAVPGVFFLSGGQSEKMATDNLEAINKTAGVPRPWMTSFCYGRALQDSCRSAWLGKKENTEAALAAFKERVSANGAAAAATP